jgi:hypothetical protein
MMSWQVQINIFLILSSYLNFDNAPRHHTDCGMLTFTDDVIRQKLKAERNGADASHIAFQHFSGANLGHDSAIFSCNLDPSDNTCSYLRL